MSVVTFQQIRAMPIYGQRALDICHPYIANIQRYTKVGKFRPKSFNILPLTLYLGV